MVVFKRLWYTKLKLPGRYTKRTEHIFLKQSYIVASISEWSLQDKKQHQMRWTVLTAISLNISWSVRDTEAWYPPLVLNVPSIPTFFLTVLVRSWLDLTKHSILDCASIKPSPAHDISFRLCTKKQWEAILSMSLDFSRPYMVTGRPLFWRIDMLSSLPFINEWYTKFSS